MYSVTRKKRRTKQLRKYNHVLKLYAKCVYFPWMSNLTLFQDAAMNKPVSAVRCRIYYEHTLQLSTIRSCISTANPWGQVILEGKDFFLSVLPLWLDQCSCCHTSNSLRAGEESWLVCFPTPTNRKKQCPRSSLPKFLPIKILILM